MGITPIDIRPVDIRPIDIRPIDIRPIGIRPIGIRPTGIRPIVVAWMLGAVLLVAGASGHAADDVMLDQLWDGGIEDEGQGLVENVIDYVALRTAMRAAPGILNARLAACGGCPERVDLERQLALAERDKSVLEAIESLLVADSDIDQWSLWKVGVKKRPAGINMQPPACIAMYDRAYDCAVAVDDKFSMEWGRACHPYAQLHTLCVVGDNRGFMDYVGFLRRVDAGEFVSEADGDKVLYYNVPAGTRLPTDAVRVTPAAVVSGAQMVFVSTDNTRPGTLHGLDIHGMALAGPNIRFARAEDFRPPWRRIVNEDNATVAHQAMLLECRYVIADSNRVDAFLFWYRERPAGAGTAYLRGRMEHHPLLRVGDPQDQCPVDATQAHALLPRIADATLQQQYGQMLAREGDPEERTVSTPQERQRAADAARARAASRGQRR